MSVDRQIQIRGEKRQMFCRRGKTTLVD